MDLFFLILVLIITGIIAGLLSGMLGIGGCSIMVPVQYWMLILSGVDSTIATRVAFCTSLAVTLPTVLSGAYGHTKRKAVNWKGAIPVGIAGIFGAMLGAGLGSTLPGEILRLVFVAVVILSAIRMVWNIKETEEPLIKDGIGCYIAIGLFVGFMSGLGGLGGGVILIPIFVFILGYSIHKAIGTSAACLIFTSAGAVFTYMLLGTGNVDLPPYSFGYLNLLQWAVLAITTVPFAQLGVKWAHMCQGKVLKQIFAGFLIILGLVMLL